MEAGHGHERPAQQSIRRGGSVAENLCRYDREQKDVQLLASHLIINGVTANRLEPNVDITRAEAAVLLERLFKQLHFIN